jgi:hypothetical protein
MGVSVTASSTVTTNLIIKALVSVAVVLATLFYLYGPPATPALRDAAVAKCNDHASGNYRSFRLDWQVGFHPHWTCWDAGKPQSAEVSFGWWVNPF